MELLEKLLKQSSGCDDALAGLLHFAIVGTQWDFVMTFELITPEACCKRDEETGKYPLQEALERLGPRALQQNAPADLISKLRAASSGCAEALQPQQAPPLYDKR
eukprot:COSAG06_NODE_6321_length_2984_cov_1.050260_4_plen_105_part_00